MKKLKEAFKKDVTEKRYRKVSEIAGNDLSIAQKNIARQEKKWFNWKLLNYWRDDYRELCASADLTKRIIEAEESDAETRNIASELKRKAENRLFCAGKRSIYESRTNPQAPLKERPGYPIDDSEYKAERKCIEELRRQMGPQELIPVKKRQEIVYQ